MQVRLFSSAIKSSDFDQESCLDQRMLSCTETILFLGVMIKEVSDFKIDIFRKQFGEYPFDQISASCLV
jgi:hypothetical protein